VPTKSWKAIFEMKNEIMRIVKPVSEHKDSCFYTVQIFFTILKENLLAKEA
jgi:hypothetical protein